MAVPRHTQYTQHSVPTIARHMYPPERDSELGYAGVWQQRSSRSLRSSGRVCHSGYPGRVHGGTTVRTGVLRVRSSLFIRVQPIGFPPLPQFCLGLGTSLFPMCSSYLSYNQGWSNSQESIYPQPDLLWGWPFSNLFQSIWRSSRETKGHKSSQTWNIFTSEALQFPHQFTCSINCYLQKQVEQRFGE